MRLNDWMVRLQALVDSRQHTRFEFGVHDCSLWACDVVQAVTGRDPAHDLRGYTTESQAQALIEQGGGLEAMAEARFGVEIKPLAATAGDVGIIDTPRGPALVSCLGMYWSGAGAFGLELVSPDAVRRAWRCEVH